MFNKYFNTVKNLSKTPTLFSYFSQIQNNLKTKFCVFKKIFAIALFFLFFGFVFGNLFGTFLSKIRNFEMWDGFIVFFLIFFIEMINFANYSAKRSQSKYHWSAKTKKKPIDQLSQKWHLAKLSEGKFTQNWSNFWKFLNYFKIGLQLGFFIDAFKVGS
jgi:hypothetical protein